MQTTTLLAVIPTHTALAKRSHQRGRFTKTQEDSTQTKITEKMLMDFVNFPFACISTQLPFWFSRGFFNGIKLLAVMRNL